MFVIFLSWQNYAYNSTVVTKSEKGKVWSKADKNNVNESY